MDGSGPREGGGAMKPAILRVCVAVVISATGLILARFVFRKEDNEVTSPASNPEFSSSPGGRNNEEEETESLDHDKQEILSLKSKFEELQKKGYEMELRFEQYCNLKDQEVMLMEHKSMLSLEKSQLNFFRKEVLAMEEEHKRRQDLVIVYLKLVGEIQELRSDNGLLEGKAKKLRRRSKQLYRVVNEKSMRFIGVEKEFLKCVDELETTNNVVKKLEDEVKDLKANIDVLQEEKEDICSRFSEETEMVSVESYRRLLEEYEELKKAYAIGVKEVINLRWSNACLRHDVVRNGTNYGENMFSPPHRNLQELMENQGDDAQALTTADVHHEEVHNQHHHHEASRRKRLMKKLKKWVEGNEKGKSKTEERCFGRHSLTVEPEEEIIFHSRRSCSSV
ncbi:PREDICTED: protein CHUP1, chloroplastic-like [Camelina sativa]|uniref:Protein CHUP1, chloroplastic-like n=1 Tax=Camelina sativa TaxID=90675 RepID=A0ABM0ZK57_CAMSA|nr:PREDICTED: protein CHUP1, chloroplastic-like [Camelina sativa]